jgi:hypothetical protein
MRSAAPLVSRTGWQEIDTRFADFSCIVSPRKQFLAGRTFFLFQLPNPLLQEPPLWFLLVSASAFSYEARASALLPSLRRSRHTLEGENIFSTGPM